MSEPLFRADHVSSLLRPENCCGRGRSVTRGTCQPRSCGLSRTRRPAGCGCTSAGLAVPPIESLISGVPAFRSVFLREKIAHFNSRTAAAAFRERALSDEVFSLVISTSSC